MNADTSPEAEAVLLRLWRVTAAFDALGVPYVIGGSFASMVHGMARATMDADIVAELRPGDAAAANRRSG